jgi:hypothetical protein
MLTPSKKITLTTVRSFIKENAENIFISHKSAFDGSIDGSRDADDKAFKKVTICGEGSRTNGEGVPGAWFVKSSRDHFTYFNKDGYEGIEVYNCCAHFIIARAI